jgi:hypothetical protein
MGIPFPENQAESDAQKFYLENIQSEEEDSNLGTTKYELFTYPADFTLEVLHSKIRAHEIEIPKLQRQFVWSQMQSSRLIESFLYGLPVPPVFMYAEKGSERLMVVDGQQRLKTIFFYFEETFGEEHAGKKTVFRLKLHENSPYDGKRFSDLKDEDQRLLKRQVLRMLIMKQVDPNDNSSIFHVFERLNTGGTQLNNQEVRNCIYSGPFNDLLLELNEDENWRKIVGKILPDKRYRDVELVLRFLALFFKNQSYTKPMKDFLTNFMINNKSGSDNQYHAKIFKSTAQKVLTYLGDKPFHIRAGLNAAVFDSVFVAFAGHENGIPEDVNDRYKALIDSEEFKELTSGATTDVDTVKQRINLAKKTLFGEK